MISALSRVKRGRGLGWAGMSAHFSGLCCDPRRRRTRWAFRLQLTHARVRPSLPLWRRRWRFGRFLFAPWKGQDQNRESAQGHRLWGRKGARGSIPIAACTLSSMKEDEA